MVGYTAFLKGAAEELSHIVFHAHSGEYNGKFLIAVCAQGSLLYDLCCQLVVGKPVSGEDGELLSADQGGKPVDGRDSGLDKVAGVFSGDRI